MTFILNILLHIPNMFVKLLNFLNDLFLSTAHYTNDPRNKNYFLLSRIDPGGYILLSYIVFVTVLGPLIMRYRKPFNLKNTIFVYNIFNIICNAYVFYETFSLRWCKHFFECQSVNFSNSPEYVREMNAYYIYFLLKVFEMLDTIFFVLRKKFNQITFLHVYHHAAMPVYAWFVVKHVAGGSLLLLPMINSFIHVIMYTYYLLASMGPEVQKYLWWKKYITSIQITQFVIGLIHLTFALYTANKMNCNTPRPVLYLSWTVTAIFNLLFIHFYIQSYSKKKTGKQIKENNNQTIKVKD